jgi:uncharacterized protein (TIGR00730 family)
MAELVEGFEYLTTLGHNITILGTKNLLPGSSYYSAAQALGQTLAERQFTVVTGGGPGIMEAASEGAFERGGASIGITMRLKGKERVNKYLTDSADFYFPFVRKLIITAPSQGFVFFPGGFGTLHQLFELLTLVETKKMPKVPIILYGRLFWQPFLDFIQLLQGEFKTITEIEGGIIQVVDSTEEVIGCLK